MSQMKGLIDNLLTTASSAFLQEGCIADQLLPEIKSSQYTGKLAGYGNGHLRIENSIIGGKGRYRRVESVIRSTQGFEIEGHGLEGLVTKQDYKNVTEPYDAEKDEAMGLSSILMLEKEKALADALGSTSVITQNTTLSGSSQFSDPTSEVMNVFATAKKAVRSGSGAVANVMIAEYGVMEVLRYHPQMLDKLGFKYDRPGGLNDSELARALGVDRIFVPSAVYNAAKEGQADNLVPVWGKGIILAQIPKTAAKYQVSLGYNVRLDDGVPRKVYKQPSFNPVGGMHILVEDEYDLLLSNVASAYLIAAAIA